MTGESKLPYVYILGVERSGSTLLSFLLNAHPHMFTIGEVDVALEILPEGWQTRRGRCSCGKPFFACHFWQSVLAGVAARGSGLDQLAVFDYSAVEMQTAHKKLYDFSAAVLDVSGASVFVDASKKADFIHPLSENPLIDLRVLNLYRDGRGIVNSWRKNNPDAVFPNLIRKWTKQEKKRAAVLKTIGRKKVFSLKYEDLCRQPEKILPKVFAFLKVKLDTDITSGYKSTVDHHIVGNPMRLSTDETIRLDEKWRREFSDGDFRVFKMLRGNAQNRKNGYWR